jgi:hypothetical protein
MGPVRMGRVIALELSSIVGIIVKYVFVLHVNPGLVFLVPHVILVLI